MTKFQAYTKKLIHFTERRPASADSCTQPAKKKVRPGTPQEPVLKSKKEMIRELREKIEHQVKQLQGEETKIAQKVKHLKVLEEHVRNANGIEASMQQSISELESLGEVYSLDDKIKREELHYTFGRDKIGVIDVKVDRGIIFTSELLGGVVHKSAAPAELEVIEEEDLDEDAAAEDETETVAIGGKKRGRIKRRRKARFVLDRERMCWVPKWYMLVGRSQYKKDAPLIEGAKKVRSLFKGAKTRLSKRSKQTLTVFSLAAAGASDWGVQSVIFGTIKALTDEMNLGLTPEELANGTPSIRSLANWEYMTWLQVVWPQS